MSATIPSSSRRHVLVTRSHRDSLTTFSRPVWILEILTHRQRQPGVCPQGAAARLSRPVPRGVPRRPSHRGLAGRPANRPSACDHQPMPQPGRGPVRHVFLRKHERSVRYWITAKLSDKLQGRRDGELEVPELFDPWPSYDVPSVTYETAEIER